MPPFRDELKDRLRGPTRGASVMAAALTLAVVYLGSRHLGLPSL